MFALLFILPFLFVSSNAEFFAQVEKERAMGATWHKIDPKPLDPNAKSIPLQLCDDDGVCEEPYVIYKLKMPEND